MNIHRYNLGGSGLTRVLGELEAKIMEAVWKLREPTGKEICDALGANVHYKTVLTVANRLVEKGLLVREPTASRAFRYHATESRDVFLDRVAASVANGLVADFGQHGLAQLVRAAETLDPVYLDQLEQLVRERKGEQ
ncbi:MAG TPA: BlaI/MecI/CopY family transcriptional regulator [Chloroflexota bacterium]|nr:BlaI/MecI/CopY family transcriptional regulator [Chloroflexota bacterium]